MATGRRLLVDGRLLGDGGTGVSSYTRAVLTAAGEAGWSPRVLRADPGASGAGARVRRWGRAIVARRRGLEVADGGDLVGADIFRLAQVHFDWWHRPLTLDAPGEPGIVHWSYPVPLRIAGWSNLYTVHDAIPLTHPHLTAIDPARHRRLLASVTEVAARIVTVSEASRAAIVAATGYDRELVVDCGQAVVLPPPARTLPAGLRAGGYLLFCGLIEPRKNLLRLIAAHRAAACGLPLVLVGPEAAGAAPILAAAVAPDVVRLAYQDRATLVALIAGARALLFPSLAEGFGLPVAEAMTLGTPALISHDPALREIAGGAAFEVDGADEAALAAAVRRLAHDDALCAELAARGKTRAGRFSVASFAERLDRLYGSLVARSG